MANKKPDPHLNVANQRDQPVKRWAFRVFGLIVAASAAYICLALWQANTAQASEGDAPVVEEVAEPLAEEPVKGSRFSQAFDLIFKGDSREIVAEANAELEQRMKAADAREAALAEAEAAHAEKVAAEVEQLESAYAEAEAARDAAKAQEAEATRQREALAQCVLGAMGQKKEASE